MSVKLTGAEFLAFMNDKAFWYDGRWYEDAVISINGGEEFDWDGEAIAPTDKIIWQGGCLYETADVGSISYDLERKLRAWLKARSVTTFLVEVPNEQVEAFRAHLKAKKLAVVV